eukprot:Amastigsp_a678738_33.p4 type:complete len:136 gc:universal Amastigsp_a678738_33:808-401(-)
MNRECAAISAVTVPLSRLSTRMTPFAKVAIAAPSMSRTHVHGMPSPPKSAVVLAWERRSHALTTPDSSPEIMSPARLSCSKSRVSANDVSSVIEQPLPVSVPLSSPRSDSTRMSPTDVPTRSDDTSSRVEAVTPR